MTAAEETPSQDGPTRSFEIERKFDVEDSTPLPDWTSIDQVVEVGVAEPRTLDALYLDTADLALARAGYAVRRRTGGPDAGWHVKGPAHEGGRLEVHWPLGEPDEQVPDVIRAELSAVLADTIGAALHPLARIQNERVAYALQDAVGGVIAEFVDDRVRATDIRDGEVRQWREWEVELGPGAPVDPDARSAFFLAVEEAVLGAGGQPAASASKLARALGH